MNSQEAHKERIMVNNTTYPGKPSDPELQWVFLGFIVILVIACIVCNSIIIAVFIAEKSIRNHANMFVVSLACADLVVGMISMPLWIADSSPNLKIHYYHKSVDILCFSASIFICALLSIERALKIGSPFWYTNYVTAFRLKVIIVLGWIAAVLVGSLSLLRGTDPNNLPYIIFISIFIYILPVLAILISYMSIFVVAHRHAKSIRKQERRIDGGTTSIRMSDAKTAWRLSVFIIVFVICWTPVFVLIWGRLFLRNRPPVYFIIVATTLPYINAVINPFLYALFNPLFRRGIVKFYKKRKGTRQRMESIRRKESSTALTNPSNSFSMSGALSMQLFPQERRELHSADLGKDHIDAHKKLLTQPHTEHGHANNEDMYISNNYETSL
jgi:hypothetical protein